MVNKFFYERISSIIFCKNEKSIITQLEETVMKSLKAHETGQHD